MDNILFIIVCCILCWLCFSQTGVIVYKEKFSQDSPILLEENQDSKISSENMPVKNCSIRDDINKRKNSLKDNIWKREECLPTDRNCFPVDSYVYIAEQLMDNQVPPYDIDRTMRNTKPFTKQLSYYKTIYDDMDKDLRKESYDEIYLLNKAPPRGIESIITAGDVQDRARLAPREPLDIPDNLRVITNNYNEIPKTKIMCSVPPMIDQNCVMQEWRQNDCYMKSLKSCTGTA